MTSQWVGVSCVVTALSACGGARTGDVVVGTVETTPDPAATEAARACVTANPELSTQPRWVRRVRDVVKERLGALERCYDFQTQASRVQIAFGKTSGGKNEVWISGANLNECGVTKCVVAELERASLPQQPEPASWEKAAMQLVLVFDPAGPKRLSLGKAAEAGLSREGACVDTSRPPVLGTLPPAHIQARVRASRMELRECYDAGLARNPRLAGRVETRFVIGPDGSVQRVDTTQNSLPDCEVVTCLRGVFHEVRYDAPQGGGTVTVVYPLQLDRRE